MNSLFPGIDVEPQSTASKGKGRSSFTTNSDTSFHEGYSQTTNPTENGYTPLARQLAPKDFDDYVGQSHLLKPGAPLRKLIEKDTLPSMILWGPPGVGKTALARLMATKSKSRWTALNAVMAKLQDLRAAIDEAREQKKLGRKTVLFIDEIHRFNKAQQDALLPDVEKGTVILLGATTENPFFSVNSSILSRCQVYELYSLTKDDLGTLVSNVLKHSQLQHLQSMSDEMKGAVIQHSGGDGRRLVNLLELLASSVTTGEEVSKTLLNDIFQSKGTLYRDDEHYDIISAFIKSVRGSDANAALYWLARMIRGGEAPEFIARRLLILASEDIGNADPNALTVAMNGLQTVKFIGWPEAKYTLSQVTIYMAQAPKSNAACVAINKALGYVDQGNLHDVPVHLRSRVRPKDPHKLDTKYVYTHDHPEEAQSFWDGSEEFYKSESDSND